MSRSQFDLSHEHKTTIDMGYLVPVQCDEVLPGDTFNQRSSALTRVAPLAHPLMHRVELRLHTFYVPNRVLHKELVRENLAAGEWEDFITGADPSVTIPMFTTTVADPLLDHMGIPPNSGGIEVQLYPLAAVNMIWNHFYRDQHLQTERGLDYTDVPKICWQKDYFTVARPDTQQGAPHPIPIGGTGTLRNANPDLDPNAPLQLRVSTGANSTYYSQDAENDTDIMSVALDGGVMNVDDLRRTLALQRFAEARMRFGERYIDYLRYLGINPSDGRLDRPEYLGGGKEVLNFSEVLSTAETANQNTGEMLGHGIGLGKTNGFSKTFEEHGWVITLMSARPKTVYENALPRKFTRRDSMDYWQKELEVLPWQEINQREVHVEGDAATVFGYVPRYEEYRHGTSVAVNTMRTTEHDWHMGRHFDTPPVLNGSFVECDPTQRIYQDSNMPDLIINVMHSIKANRLVGQMASMGVDL